MMLSKAEKQLVDGYKEVFNHVVNNCIDISRPTIIITDEGTQGHKVAAMLAHGYHKAIPNSQLIEQGIKRGYMHANPIVEKRLRNLDSGNIILCVSEKLGRLGHVKSFRRFCKENNHVFYSATSLGKVSTAQFAQYMEALNINYKRLTKLGDSYKRKLDRAARIRVMTEIGTDLWFHCKESVAVCNTGAYAPGQGGNMPVGEVYIPPSGDVSGRIVLDGSIKTRDGSKILNEPVILTIERSVVTDMSGPDAHLLTELFQQYEERAQFPDRVRRVAQIGFGINPKSVLMGLPVLDQKTLGTAYIGIGSNYWFGGDNKTIFHGDFVFKNPKVFIDGEEFRL